MKYLPRHLAWEGWRGYARPRGGRHLAINLRHRGGRHLADNLFLDGESAAIAYLVELNDALEESLKIMRRVTIKR